MNPLLLLLYCLVTLTACSPGSPISSTAPKATRSPDQAGAQSGTPSARSKTPIVFAAVSNSSPKFIDAGPLKGTGWVEFQTRPILKGMKQDGFLIQVEYMTPARIEHEFRVKSPICTYPVEWIHPEQLFSTKPNRIYSIPLDLGGESTSSIAVRNDQLHKFKPYLDSKGSVDILRLIQDPNFKTQLIRDKDYGPLTTTMTTRDASGDQIPRKLFEKNISLRVLSANQQTLEMLNAGRFDYAFYNDIEAEDFTRSKLDPKAFTLVPFQTGRVKDEQDPNLVRISIACSDSSITREAMPYFNQWIRMNRGLLTNNQVLAYKASIDLKSVQSRDMVLTTTERFRDSFENGALDGGYVLQQKHFSDLALYPKRAEGLTQAGLSPPSRGERAKGGWFSFYGDEAGKESLTLINRSTGLYTRNKVIGKGLREEDNLSGGIQIPVESSVRKYLAPQEQETIDSVSLLKRSETLGFLKDSQAGSLKKLTLFGDLDQESLNSIQPLLPGLSELRVFHATAETLQRLVPLLPSSLKHLNLFGSVVSGSDLAGKLKQLRLLSLHLNHTSLSPAQFKQILPLLSSIEHLSLGMLRTTLTEEGVALFAQQSFKNLKSLDLENSAVSDAQAQMILKSLPDSIESLNLSGNRLTPRGLSLLFQKSFPHLTTLKLNDSLIGFPKPLYPPQGLSSRRHFPQSVRHLFLANSGLSDVTLQQVELPQSLLSLDFGDNKLGDASLGPILKSLASDMELLNLGSNSLSEGGLKQLIDFIRERRIRVLKISYLRITDALVERLFARPLQDLKDLDLSGNQISDRGARFLARGLGPELVGLSLSANPIAREGFIEIAKHFSSHLTSLNLSSMMDLPLIEMAPLLPRGLKILNLNNNQISDQDMQALAPYLPKELRGLHLHRSAFSAVGAGSLANNLPNFLEDLDLVSTPIGEAGLLAIARALPSSTRFLGVGGVELSVNGTQEFLKALPNSLRALWLQPIALTREALLHFFQNLPPRLEQLRFYGAPRVTITQSASVPWPKTLREIYLQGVTSLSKEANINWMNQLPRGVHRLALMGFGLDDAGLATASQLGLKDLNVLALTKSRISITALNAALNTFGSVRGVQHTGNEFPFLNQPQEFDRGVWASVRFYQMSQLSLSTQQLESFLMALPEDLWDLDLSANQIHFNQVERLLKLLPKRLQVLRFYGNDLGMKGFQRLEEYKRQREERDGVPFELQW